LTGVAVDSVDLGTFTGATIADNVTIKAALQALETSLELKAVDTAVVHLVGAEVLESKSLESSCALVDAVDNTKTIGWDLSGAGAGTSLTIASSQTANLTLSIPVLTGAATLVTLEEPLQQFTAPMSFADNVTISNEKVLKMYEATGSGSNYVGLKAPNALAADTTYVLPMADGDEGDVLITDGSAALSFGAAVRLAKVTFSSAELVAATTGVAAVKGPVIPIGALVTRAWFNVVTPITGDGDSASTVSIGIQDQAVDVQAAAAVSGAPFDAAGLEEGSVGIDGTVAKMIAISGSAKQVSMTWTAAGTDATLTAGSVTVYAEYVI